MKDDAPNFSSITNHNSKLKTTKPYRHHQPSASGEDLAGVIMERAENGDVPWVVNHL
jgi:hypothetical protein